MNMYKVVIKKILGYSLYSKLVKLISNIKHFISLIINLYVDGKLFYKHSMIFKQNTYNKIEARLILYYHAIEKGFLHDKFKFRFGEKKIIELIKLLKLEEISNKKHNTQIAAAYLAICKYYEKHELNKINISDYYTNNDYLYFKSLSTLNIEIIKKHNSKEFFINSKNEFKDFSKSRSSVRNFAEEMIPLNIIYKVIELAKTAPSVCNRQPVKVYYVENKEKIKTILKLQGGLTGYSDEIFQLFIIVSDRNFYYTIGERNQLYIDGGIFLMNLIYACHYYNIASCPAHWAFDYKYDKIIQKELNLSESEKIICLIPFGVPKEDFFTTLSLRKDNKEILNVVK